VPDETFCEHPGMTKIVRAFPLLPGREGDLQDFIDSMNSRADEAAAFFSKYGVRSETWHTQPTPNGTLVIVTTEMEDESVLPDYARSDGPFERWFKDQVKQVSGIDLDETPKGAPSREAYHWSCDDYAG
jgi:hypothetical protein